MKKHLLVIGLVVFTMFVFGCKHSEFNESQESLLNFAEATRLLNSAHNEAIALTSSASRNIEEQEYDPDDYHTWNLEDRLKAAAWLSIQTGDDSEVIQIAKENGIYDDLMKIAEKYDVENCLKAYDEAVPASRSVTEAQFGSLKTGNIVLSRTLSSSGSSGSSASGSIIVNLFAGGYYKHAGIIDKTYGVDPAKCILSASSTAEAPKDKHKGLGVFGRVGYESVDAWTKKDKRVVALYVKNATATQAEDAVKEGQKYIGYSYGVSDRNKDTNFYCSKVVYRCWKSQNIYLDDKSDIVVTPQDLYDDEDTIYLFGDKKE